jgi:hypothetical protein
MDLVQSKAVTRTTALSPKNVHDCSSRITGLGALRSRERFSDEQIVGFLREAELAPRPSSSSPREHGFAPNSSYVWQWEFGYGPRS